MKTSILSDLHLEHHHFEAPETDADVVVLAGDISVGVDGLRWAAAQPAFAGKPIIFVPGNHEYYSARLERTAVEMRKYAKQVGIHLLVTILPISVEEMKQFALSGQPYGLTLNCMDQGQLLLVNCM